MSLNTPCLLRKEVNLTTMGRGLVLFCPCVSLISYWSESKSSLIVVNGRLIVKLATASRTTQPRLQYIEYVEILKLFIRAERSRSGNWSLHLVAICNRPYTLHKVCPVISSDHGNTKVLRSMRTMRRSDRFWADL